MENLQQIKEKAQQHQARYKTFDVHRFMNWVASHDYHWQEWAVDQTIPALARMMRYDRYQIHEQAVAEWKKKYTDEYYGD